MRLLKARTEVSKVREQCAMFHRSPFTCHNPVMASSKAIGAHGEDAAVEFLLGLGYRIISRNYRKPYGEIDIAALRSGVIHFVEVKTSKFFKNSDFMPEIRINARKIKSMKRVCEVFIQDAKLPDHQKWQIDVISVIIDDAFVVKEIRYIDGAVFEKPY